MRCLMCAARLEAIASDNLAIYRCPDADCPLYRLYQAGLPEPEDAAFDELVEQLIQQHHDEPPAAPVAAHSHGR